MANLRKGDKAPDFKLLDQNSQEVSLSDYYGSKLLIYFYPKADTPGCTKQSCQVSQSKSELARAGIKSVGISPDTPDKQSKFDEKYSLGFPLLCDTDHKVAEAYGVWGEKTSFGQTKMGIIRSSFLVDETGVIIDAWYKVSPEDTVPNVLG
ncbi:MAG: thioredoxin-dependent thiol peroxidase [Sedimentisphaerales bacterium]|nr:thioredoxin-dependent thiol peroxidase [Sedimentisphaerales bacterium]